MTCEWKGFDRRDAWLQARRAYITSTDAPVILGLSRYKGPWQLYHEKRGELEPPEPGPWARWGLVLEDVIAQIYADETGRPVRQPLPDFLLAMACRTDLPLAATIDRFADDAGATVVVEVKNASAFRADEWTDLPPLEYLVQVQHQLAVTGAPKGSLAVLIGGNRFKWADVPRDEAVIGRLIEAEMAFYERLQKGDPPAPDGRPETAEAIARLYRRETGPPVLLPGEAIEWDQERERAREQIKVLEDRVRTYEALIKTAIGEASEGVLPNGVRYTWRTQRRAGYTVEPAEFRVLRRHGK
jgi:putative phage-type endonuclease